MKDLLVSILIPIYNVEAYLPRCIDSVLSQDFKDYELILVDDGSPDKCPEICDEYASKYDFIKVVHKENGGLISARRAGVLAASGQYLMFLDSDDWLMPGAVDMLYRAIKGTDFDMVKGSAIRVDEKGKTYPLESYQIEEGLVTGPEEFLTKMYTGKVAPYLWGALYKASLFSEDTFNESIEKRISLGEDVVTNLIVGLKVKRVLYIKDIVYNYYVNPSSIMSMSVVSREYGNRLEAFLHDRVFVHYSKLIEWQKAKFAAYCFRNCFIPEKGFDKDYDSYVIYFKDEKLSLMIKECILPKFLLFVSCKPLFWTYSFLYRMALRVRHISNSPKRYLR